jgi:hypothetical protein
LGGTGLETRPGKKLVRPHLDKQVVCGGAHLLSYIGRRIMVQGRPQAKSVRPYLKNKQSIKRAGGLWFKWWSICLASVRPWIQTPVPPPPPPPKKKRTCVCHIFLEPHIITGRATG